MLSDCVSSQLVLRFKPLAVVYVTGTMAEESKPEDYPQEIDEQLASFGSSVCSVRTMLEKLTSMPRNELLKVG